MGPLRYLRNLPAYPLWHLVPNLLGLDPIKVFRYGVTYYRIGSLDHAYHILSRYEYVLGLISAATVMYLYVTSIPWFDLCREV